MYQLGCKCVNKRMKLLQLFLLIIFFKTHCRKANILIFEFLMSEIFAIGIYIINADSLIWHVYVYQLLHNSKINSKLRWTKKRFFLFFKFTVVIYTWTALRATGLSVIVLLDLRRYLLAFVCCFGLLCKLCTFFWH